MSGELPVRGTARQCDDGMIEMRLTVSFADREQPGKAIRRPTRAPDFSSVNWFGTIYTFRGKQRVIVATLWLAMEEGYRWVGQDLLLQEAESEGGRVRDIFRGNSAWGELIVPAVLYGGHTGSFGLGDPPG